jgi:DNA-directed RNA polymerase subunit RPC12/RpoP
MDSWNYLKFSNNDKPKSPQTCPYCGTILRIITKSFLVEFKIPKIPPIGAKDLNICNHIHNTYLKKYFSCINCGAKYDYNSFDPITTLRPITYIPSSKMLMDIGLNNELPK